MAIAVTLARFPQLPAATAVSAGVAIVTDALPSYAVAAPAAVIRAGQLNFARFSGKAWVACTCARKADAMVVAVGLARNLLLAVGTGVAKIAQANISFAVSMVAACARTFFDGATIDTGKARLTVAPSTQALAIPGAPVGSFLLGNGWSVRASNLDLAALAHPPNIAHALAIETEPILRAVLGTIGAALAGSTVVARSAVA